MTLGEAFKLRELIQSLTTKENATAQERATAMVIENIMRGEYDRLKDAKSVAEDDVNFLVRTNYKNTHEA